MKGHGAKFGRKWEEAIAALLTQRNTEDAARAVGIGVSTLLRWMKEPEFNAAYREARRTAFGQSVARLKVMIDPSTPPSTKVRAADSVLGHSAKAIEIEDIDARLTELERTAETTKGQRR